VVRCLLAKNPRDRYASAEAVLADLQAHARPRAARRKLATSAAAAALVLLLVGTAPAAWQRWKAPRFSHLVQSGEIGVAAIGRDGRTLWTRRRTELYNLVLARLKPGDAPQLVGVLDALSSAEAAHTLSVLDPESGRKLWQVRLPSGARSFPAFSNTFHPTLWAIDLDGDGGDEIVASYLHWPWWPSYTVLYEPKIDRSRVLFLGSGHHRFTGAHDLDGDGRAELLLIGINNRMGWYTGIAAVKPDPWINDVSSRVLATASTPDAFYAGSSPRTLLWYVLGPRERFVNEDRPFVLDETRKTLRFIYTGERELVLGFDGFPVDASSSLPSSRREVVRREAYDRIREAERLLQAGYPDQALAEAEAARRRAETAGDPRLSDWTARLRARTLIFAGRLPEAEAAFQELFRTSEAAADIAYDAGKAFHLNGALERAVSWYRLGLSRGGSADAGRLKWELMEEIVLALAELGRNEEALAEIDDFVTAYPDLRDPGEVCRHYLRWKMKAPVSPEGLPINAWSPDLWRYWRLELQLSSGEEPRRLLREIEKELPRNSESDPQLLSLRGEILARLGQPEPAAQAAKEGYELAKRQRRENTGVHAHFSLIAERALRLARAAGDETTAHEAERELAQWGRTD
jgi:tetratricopeptide (TPR) repeat protein